MKETKEKKRINENATATGCDSTACAGVINNDVLYEVDGKTFNSIDELADHLDVGSENLRQTLAETEDNDERTAKYDFESSRRAIEKKTHNGFECDTPTASEIIRFCKGMSISQARYKLYYGDQMHVYIGNDGDKAKHIFEFKFDNLKEYEYHIYNYDFNNRKLIKVIEPYFNFVVNNFSGTRVLYSRSKKTGSDGVTDSNYKKLRESTLSSITISVFI